MATVAYHDYVDSGTQVIKDSWIYRWRGKDAPREFLLHKAIFRPMRPVDIVAAQCIVLEPAIKELTTHLYVPKEHLRDPKINWLCLQGHDRLACQVALHDEKYVVAANRITSDPSPFIPSRFFRILTSDSQWKDLDWYSGHRRLCANFNTGLSFYSDRFACGCDVAYHLHFGVHGVHTLWASLQAERDNKKRIMALPCRMSVSSELKDLPGKIQLLSGKCDRFISRMGASWLHGHDKEEITDITMSFLKGLPVPYCRLQELESDPELLSCATRLDVLLFLSQVFQDNPINHAPDLIHLSKNISKGLNLT